VGEIKPIEFALQGGVSEDRVHRKALFLHRRWAQSRLRSLVSINMVEGTKTYTHS